MHENIQIYGFKSSVKSRLKGDSWDGVMADGILCGKGQPCALLIEGLSIAFSESFLGYTELSSLSSWEEMHLLLCCFFGQVF